jgi:hypothetical protein
MNFPEFCGNQGFIKTPTSLAWGTSIQSTVWIVILILTPKCFERFPPDFPTESLNAFLFCRHATNCSAHLVLHHLTTLNLASSATMKHVKWFLLVSLPRKPAQPSSSASYSLEHHSPSLCSPLNSRNQILRPCKAGKITVPYKCLFFGRKWGDKRYGPSGSRHSPNLICSWFLHACSFYLF